MKIYEKLSDNTFAELEVDNSDGLFYGENEAMYRFALIGLISCILFIIGLFIYAALFN